MAKPLSAPLPATDWPALLRRAGLGLLALLLLSVPVFFYTETQDQFELPKQLLLRALSSGLLGLFLAALLLEPGAKWRRTPLDLPVLLWSLWLGVKTISSVSPAVSWRGEYENFAGSLTQLNYSLLFFLAVQLAARLDQGRLLLRALLAAATGAAVYGLMQACQRDVIAWSAASVVSDRFFGPLGNPNFLGGLMAMAIVLKLALAWQDGRQAQPRDPDLLGRWAVLLGWVLVYLALDKAGMLNPFVPRPGAGLGSQTVMLLWLLSLLSAPLARLLGLRKGAYFLGQAADLLLYFQVLANTGTRGAFLGLMLGLLALALGWLALRQAAQGDAKPLLWRATGAGLLLLLLLGLAIGGLGSSFRARTLASLKDPRKALEVSRLQIWVPALKIWAAYPIGGSGVDSFKTVFPAFSRSRFAKYDGENVSSRMAHCEPLQVLATEGLVGLGLWTWLCLAVFAAWWARLRRAVEPEARALLLGLGALAAAYLGQNLVSFGVAGISAPFWVCLGLLFCTEAGETLNLKLPKLGLSAALTAGLALAAWGLWMDKRTLDADLDYAFASQAQAQMGSLDRASFDEIRNAAGWAYQKLSTFPRPLPLAYQEEMAIWRDAVLQGEQQLQAQPSAAAALRPTYLRAAGALLMSLAALRLEEAVALCPGEVKYRVYVGLCYEELFRRSTEARRHLWFQEAANAYEVASAMNPRNAYYHGNQARLYALGSESGSEDFYVEAQKHYLEAVELAPVTRLFYENLLLLDARFAKVKEAGQLLDKVEATDKELAPSLLIAGASTMFQWRLSKTPAWTPAAQQAAQVAALDWTRRAMALDPSNAEYALAMAVFQESLGKRDEARRYGLEALRIKPGYEEALRYMKEKKL